MASRLLRLRAMTRALPTGLVALVTLPSTCRKAGRGTSDCAGTARITMADAIAIARSLRISLPPFIPARESKESPAASQMEEGEVLVRSWEGAGGVGSWGWETKPGPRYTHRPTCISAAL